MGVDRGLYRREVPKWASYVDEKGLIVKWKKELKPFLDFDNPVERDSVRATTSTKRNDFIKLSITQYANLRPNEKLSSYLHF